MEIMGIAIIMVLFSIGLLIFLSLSMKPPSDLKERVDLTEYATNFITVMLRTTTECNGATVETLLKDIASYNQPIICDVSGYTSLQYLAADDSPVTTMLQESIEKKYPDRDYFLVFCDWDSNKQGCACPGWDTSQKTCSPNNGELLLRKSNVVGMQQCTTYTLKVQPIPTDRGVLSLALWLCERKSLP